MIQEVKNTMCRVIGHSWRYKDYSNWMRTNGERYDFRASRNCTRCNQYEYLNKSWEIKSEKSVHDVERFSTKELSYI